MYEEWPMFHRCCFCIPLRFGLIGWGYIRLILSLIALSTLFFWFYRFMGIAIAYHVLGTIEFWFGLIIMIICMSMGVGDVVANIHLIVGGITKNVKYLERYFLCSFFLCVLSTVFGMIITCFSWNPSSGNHDFIGNVIILITQIVVQGYVLLLVNSEIVKLKNTFHSQLKNKPNSESVVKCNDGFMNVSEPDQCKKVPVIV